MNYYQTVIGFLEDKDIDQDDVINCCEELMELGYPEEAAAFLMPIIEDESADQNNRTFACIAGRELGEQYRQRMQAVINTLSKKKYDDWEILYSIGDVAYELGMRELATKLFLEIADQMPKDHTNYDHFLMTLSELGEVKKTGDLQGQNRA